MSKPKFPKVLAVSNAGPIPFVTEEMLTAQAGYLVSEAGIVNLEAALVAAENTTELQTQLEAKTGELNTAKANLATATGELTTAKADLATAKTALTAAQTETATWKAKAIEFGAKSADSKVPEVPGKDANAEVDEVQATLDKLPHNQKADRLLG